MSRRGGELGMPIGKHLINPAGPAAADLMLGPQTEFDPDLVVVRMDQIGGAKFTEPPLLVVEIRSPGTALIDLNRKKAAYDGAGRASGRTRAVASLLRRGGRLVATTSGPFTVGRPFAVSIDPADLTRGLHLIERLGLASHH